MREAILRMHIWIVALFVPLIVRLFSLKRVLGLATPPTWIHPYTPVSCERIAELVRKRLERPWMMKRRACLREGLTLFHFLCLARQPAILQIGVFEPGPAGTRSHAHCWVTLNGRPLSHPPEAEVATVVTHTQASRFANQALHDPKVG